MGTWSVESFGNDGAADWCYELEGCKDLSFIEKTLDEALSSGFVDASAGENAIAAAEAVARLQGNGGLKDAYSKPVDDWVEKNKLEPSPELLQKARRAIDLILSDDSELLQLWQDMPEMNAWRANVENLKSRLV